MANAILNVGQTGGQVNISTAAAPATPAAGVVTLYAGTDKALHALNSDGTDITIAAGMTGPTGPQGQTGATGPAGSNATSPITLEQTNSLVSTAIGATATAGSSVVIGATACSFSSCSIVIGGNSRNCGGKSIIIGSNSCVPVSTSNDSIVIGNCAYTDLALDYGGKVVIGAGARGGYAGAGVAIGINSRGNNGSVGILNTNVGEEGVAVGNQSNTGYFGTAVGKCAISGDFATALGAESRNSGAGQCSVSVGRCAITESACSISLGFLPRIFTGATGAIAIGANSVGGTGACNSVVLGNSSQTLTSGSIVIGASAKDKSTTGGTLVGAIVIGNGACICEGNAYNGHIAIGRGAKTFEQNSAVAIGDGASAENIGVAIGCFASAGTASIALGGGVSASGLYAAAIGRGSRATAQGAQAYGYDACATVNYGNAIGWESRVCSSGTNGVAIGYQSCSTHACAVALGSNVCTTRANTTHVQSLVVYGQAASPSQGVGNFGSTATLNWDNSNIQTLTLTGSVTTLNKTNPIDGGVYTVFVTQGGSGGYTVDWGTDVKWAGGTGPTLSTAAGAIDAVSLIYIAGVTGYFGNANLNFS